MQGVGDQGEAARKDATPNLSQGQDTVRPDGYGNAFILGLGGHMYMFVAHWIYLVGWLFM